MSKPNHPSTKHLKDNVEKSLNNVDCKLIFTKSQMEIQHRLSQQYDFFFLFPVSEVTLTNS
jgi:hypothetical protein